MCAKKGAKTNVGVIYQIMHIYNISNEISVIRFTYTLVKASAFQLGMAQG